MLKPIPGYPDYFASHDGEIYSMKPVNGYSKKPDAPRKLKKLLTGRDGMMYNSVWLYRGGCGCLKKISILMLETFVSKRPTGMWACHGANGRLDDSLNNLYWATPSQNALDKHRDGTMNDNRGEKSGTAKLNEMQVRIIRKAYSPRGRNGLSSYQLAKIFKVHQVSISSIITGKHWRHI